MVGEEIFHASALSFVAFLSLTTLLSRTGRPMWLVVLELTNAFKGVVDLAGQRECFVVIFFVPSLRCSFQFMWRPLSRCWFPLV